MRTIERVKELRTLDQVQAMTGMGSTWIYEQIKAGTFPSPIKIGRRSLRVLSELDTSIRGQIQLYRQRVSIETEYEQQARRNAPSDSRTPVDKPGGRGAGRIELAPTHVGP